MSMQPQKKQGRMDRMLYEMQLKGPSPDKFICVFEDAYRPNAQRAEKLLSVYREMCTEGKHGLVYRPGLSSGMAQHWIGADASARDDSLSYSALHRFTWLRHLTALDEVGLDVARALLDGWLTLYDKYDPDIWTPVFTTERLLMLSFYGPEILRGMSTTWRAKVLTSMARQTRHLAKIAARVENRQERLLSAIVLCFAGLTLQNHHQYADQGSNLLQRELRLQLRQDGGHVSRNPSFQLRLALLLQALLGAYKETGYSVPNFLYNATGRVTSLLEFYRCQDGRLAVFNGGYEDDMDALDAALEWNGTTRSKIDFASQTGYQRLVAAKTSVFSDLGIASGQPVGARARRQNTHAQVALSTEFDGGFSFQLSSGRQRLVVNCGNAPEAEWSAAFRQPAAHSSLSFENIREAEKQNEKRLPAWHRLREDGQGQFLEMERQLTEGMPGATHQRRLFLSADGMALRGSDSVIPSETSRFNGEAVLRFHLHPSIKPSLVRNGRSVLLISPQNEGWSFKSNAVNLNLEKSIYAGVQGQKQKAHQIILYLGRDFIGQNVKWAFTKLDHLQVE